MQRRRFKQTNHLKDDFPTKRSACELKPNCFHLARYATN